MKRLGYEGIQTIAMEAERPNLVGEIGGGGQVLMLNGHIDTKPTGDLSEWSPGPYDPVIRDGRLSGLGSADMKGAVAAMVHAGAALIETGAPPGTLRVVLTADEEAGSRYGARFLAGRPEVAADAVDRPGPQADAGQLVVLVVDAGIGFVAALEDAVVSARCQQHIVAQ